MEIIQNNGTQFSIISLYISPEYVLWKQYEIIKEKRTVDGMENIGMHYKSEWIYNDFRKFYDFWLHR